MNLAYFIGGPLDLTKMAVQKALPNYWAANYAVLSVRPAVYETPDDDRPWVREHQYMLVDTFPGEHDYVLIYRYVGLNARDQSREAPRRSGPRDAAGDDAEVGVPTA